MYFTRGITAAELYGENHKYNPKVMEVILPIGDLEEVYEIHVYEDDILTPHFHVVKDNFDCALCIYEARYYGRCKDKLSNQQLLKLYEQLISPGFNWSDIADRYYREVTMNAELYLFGYKEEKHSDICPYYPDTNKFFPVIEQNSVDAIKTYIPLIYGFESSTLIKDITLDGELFRIRVNPEQTDSDTFSVSNYDKICIFKVKEPNYAPYSKSRLSDKQLEELTDILSGPLQDWLPEQSVYQQILDYYFEDVVIDYPDYKNANNKECD